VQVQVMPAGPAVTAPARPLAKPAVPQPVAVKPVPAKPVAVPPAPASKPPAAASATPKTVTKPPAPVTPPAATGSKTVQIGAFSSEAKAEEEWARVSGKAKLTGKQIQKLTSSSGKTMWRVRGTAADPDASCKAILAVKGACEVKK
jgi:cell division protein FtsN